jgi:phage head maturation protease
MIESSQASCIQMTALRLELERGQRRAQKAVLQVRVTSSPAYSRAQRMAKTSVPFHISASTASSM